MHILVVNDDGPPSSKASPYVHSLVHALQQQGGHTVSVVLPHIQRSWIGKAHLVNEHTIPSYFRPGNVHEDDGTTHALPLPADAPADAEEWVLVNGTPATCSQLGLYHFYQDRPPVDLVVSGPNFGRNSTALYSLSSGTVGGAMEAANCGYKAIALSFAFSPKTCYERDLIDAACRLSVKIVDHLAANWDDGVELYNVNVPLIQGVETRPITWTHMLNNKWQSGSAYREVDMNGEPQSKTEERTEMSIRKKQETTAHSDEIQNGSNSTINGKAPTVQHSRHQHREFKWTPSAKDVHDTASAGGEGNDGLAIINDCISITPLKSNFMHAFERSGELKLEYDAQRYQQKSSESHENTITAYIHYDDSYVQPLIEQSLNKMSVTLTPSNSPFTQNTPMTPFLQISSYETIDHELLLKRPTHFLANSYTIRKALIRKEYLAYIVRHWAAKHPEALLGRVLPETISLQLDYAEFLDDALVEGDGMMLMPIFEANGEKSHKDRDWWMVKASMADRGQGIKLFSTFEELQGIFEEWEVPDSDDEADDDDDSKAPGDNNDGDDTAAGEGMTSNLRHFVLQRYISPLLLPSQDKRKFHVRCYVVAVGALKVYVYREMLALFSAKTYQAPDQTADQLDLGVHLTNTCLQDGSREGSVERFWDLPDNIPGNGEVSSSGERSWKQAIFDDICTATGQLFQAAKSSPTDFQPLPNAFELYGVDWLVGENSNSTQSEGPNYNSDSGLTACLLEVNAFPDLKQTGDDLKDVIGGLWEGIMAVAVAPFFGLTTANGNDNNEYGQSTPAKTAEDRYGMHLVWEEDMRR